MAAFSVEQKAAVAASRAIAKARREAFAARVDEVSEGLDLPAEPLVGVGRLPAWAKWRADNRQLVVLVPEGEHWRTVDKALAYGLAHAKGRTLTLVLPKGVETATCVRAAFLNHSIDVYTHAEGEPTRQVALDQNEAQVSLREKAGLRLATHSLGTKEEWVQRLVGWANGHASLTRAHRSQYMSWHAYGMQLLKIRKTAGGLEITSGIHYSGPKKPIPRLTSGPMSLGIQAEVQREVETGIGAARAREAGPYKEHLLQENLMRHRVDVGWPESDVLIREFPALRPNGGTGYIDFVRVEHDGTMHIIETKIGLDEFVVLQGLDYWIWARSNKDLLRERFGSAHGIKIRDDVVVDYVLGDESKPGHSVPILSPYADAHLSYLPPEMRWRLHKASPIDSGRVQLEALDSP